MRYVAFDIEAANGFKPYSICSVGVVTADASFNVIEKENIWVNPKTKYNLNGTRESVGINLNLDPLLLAQSPDFKGVYTKLRDILEDKDTVVIGHAVDSDIIMLNSACKHNSLPPINFTYTCTQLLFKQFKEEKDVRSLSKIAAEIGVMFNAHSSDDDAFVSMLTLKYLCEKTGLTFNGLLEKYAIRKGATNEFKVNRCVSLIGSVKKNITQGAVNTIKDSEKKVCDQTLKGYVFSFSRELEIKYTAEISALVGIITSCGGIYASKIGKCNVYISNRAAIGFEAEKLGGKGVLRTSDFLREQHVKKSSAIVGIEEIRSAGIMLESNIDIFAAARVLKRIVGGRSEYDDFLEAHKLNRSTINGERFISEFISEMTFGLSGEVKSLKMLPTFINPENEITEGNYLVADAGGSTLKYAVAQVSKSGVVLSGQGASCMAGVKNEVSHAELYDSIAQKLLPLADAGESIGFCFSYPLEMHDNGDGELIKWTKEIKAPEAVGKAVGESLLSALMVYSNTERSVFVLNDTAAVLLSCYSSQYSACVGLVFGTGINISYVENAENIKKLKTDLRNEKMIINIEAGNFNKFDLGDIDRKVCYNGEQVLEKMCSGRYIGDIAKAALYKAFNLGLIFFGNENTADNGNDEPCTDKSFTEVRSEMQYPKELNSLTTAEVSAILSGKPFASKESGKTVRAILNAIVERSAKITALAVSSAALKTLVDNPCESDKPVVAIIAEGTTFYSLHGFKELFCSYLDEYLTLKNNISYEIIDSGSTLKGAAAAIAKFRPRK